MKLINPTETPWRRQLGTYQPSAELQSYFETAIAKVGNVSVQKTDDFDTDCVFASYRTPCPCFMCTPTTQLDDGLW